MSDLKIITADQARDMLDNKVAPYPYTGNEFDGFRDADGELVVWEDDATRDYCTTPQFISGALIAPDLLHTVIAQAEQIEKLERGGAELGRIIKDQLDMVVDATGLHHLIRDDGDGDWEAVWMTLIERAKAHPDYRNPEATP